ncbi:MAG: porin [Nitrospira sp.]|nr:porin [Nitrospira sp.]
MKRWWFAVSVCAIGLGLIFQTNPAQANGVEDLLYEKGQITKEEWVKLKADQEKQDAIVADRASITKWFDKISIRGYVQARYTYLPGDKSIRNEYDNTIRDDTGFAFRRARLVFSGDITDWLSFYIQPEFAGTVPGTTGDQSNHFVQLRDAYTDIFLPVPFLFLDKKELRIRAGLSKVPFGFETLQSSQNRIAFDRSDGMNSAVNGERDLGFFIYYTPTETRKLFRKLVDSGLKGSGDYGVLGVGVYNGQTLNVTERNDNKHIVLHATYPMELPYGQIIQFGVDAYRGTFNVGATVPLTTGGPAVGRENNGNILDERVGVHFILYPQPIGFQAEWNWGHGPQLNATRTAVEEGDIQGGYVQGMYKWDVNNWTTLTPYVRYQEYSGGKKHRTNAPFNVVREWEVGLEWQFTRSLEFTIAYARSRRTDTQTAPYNIREGDVVRTQLQYNF